MTELEHGLRNLLTAGKRIFVPYVTGGLVTRWEIRAWVVAIGDDYFHDGV